MTATSQLQLPSLNKLYDKRRSQRDNALRKVIKLSYELQHTKFFLNNLEAWRSAIGGHYVPDHFVDLIADTLQGEESQLEVAVDQLALANKRLQEARNATDRKLHSCQVPQSVVEPAESDLAQDANRYFETVAR